MLLVLFCVCTICKVMLTLYLRCTHYCSDSYTASYHSSKTILVIQLDTKVTLLTASFIKKPLVYKVGLQQLK